VGVHVAMFEGDGLDSLQERVSMARSTADRIRWVPLPFDIKAQLLTALVLPQGLYGCSAAALSRRQTTKMRGSIMKALWGDKRGRRCVEVVLTLMAPGHLIDPVQLMAVQRLVTLRRMLASSEELVGIFRRIWVARRYRRDLALGPIGLVYAAVDDLHWKWVSPFEFETMKGTLVHMLNVSPGEWGHLVRDAARRALWLAAAQRRANLMGLEAGVDREATASLLSSAALLPYSKGVLRSILADAVWTQERLHRAGMADSSICPHCEEAVETHEHLWWHCKAWEHHRRRHYEAKKCFTNVWPPCLKCCGIMPEVDEHVVQSAGQAHEGDGQGARDQQMSQAKSEMNWKVGLPSARQVGVVDLTVSEGHAHVESQLCREIGTDAAQGSSEEIFGGECYHEGFLVAYTDGAASHNQSRTARRAGAGVFFSHGNPKNLSLALPGPTQTNQRAELYAVLRVLRARLHCVEVRTDSKYVIDGCVAQRRVWRAREWRTRRGPLANMDLWQEVDALLEARPAWSIRFVKVKGHSTWEDVARGKVSVMDKLGNDAADGLAVAGARLHGLPAEIDHTDAKWRVLVARDVQRMMVEILLDRQLRCPPPPGKRRPPVSSMGSGVVEGSDSDSCSQSSSRASSSGSSSSLSSRASARRRRGRAAPSAPD